MFGSDFFEEVSRKVDIPSDIETIYFMFWEKGIDFNTFNELPLPYIFSILKVQSYFNKEQEKANKKAQRK
jgi:hypothetical protein